MCGCENSGALNRGVGRQYKDPRAVKYIVVAPVCLKRSQQRGIRAASNWSKRFLFMGSAVKPSLDHYQKSFQGV